MLLDLFIIVLVFFIITSKTENNVDNPIGKVNTITVRALLMVSVFFRHIYAIVEGEEVGYFLKLFEGKGFWCVAAFFFFSGYGLVKALSSKGEVYLKTFLKKRLPSVVIPYISAIILFFVVRIIILNEKISFSPIDIIKRIYSTLLLVDYSWYVLEIVFLYVIFYLSFKYINQRIHALITCSISVIIFTFLCAFLGANIAYYISTFSFVFGMFYAQFYENIDNFVMRFKYIALAILPIMIYILSGPYAWVCVNGVGHFSNIFFAVQENIISLSFVYIIVILLHKVNTTSKIGSFLGGLSYEAYLMQGIGIRLCRSKWFYINNAMVYVIVSLLICFMLAIFLKAINKRIFGYMKQYL